MPPWDVAVVGAGAAGLLAGIAAGRTGAATLVLEKGEKPGRKLALTGGGRCNFTNTLEPREFVARFGDPGARHLGRALALLPGRALRALLARQGVGETLERGIRLYTQSGRAEQVVEALARELAENHAVLQTGLWVGGVRRTPHGFRLTVDGAPDLEARTLVLCTGGLSYPGTGSTGEGHAWARELGHETTPLRPGLIGLATLEEWPRSLAGMVLPEAAAALLEPGRRKPLAREQAELLFTHSGLSGPAVLDLSLALARTGLEGACLLLDFLPGRKPQEVEGLVDEACHAHPRRSAAGALAGLLPGRLLGRLASAWPGPAAGLAREARSALSRALKQAVLSVRAPREIQAAEVTVGGIAWAEIDPATLESRRLPGLFFAGELLDVAGRCGGFNLQAAFSTGFLAGSAAAARALAGRQAAIDHPSR